MRAFGAYKLKLGTLLIWFICAAICCAWYVDHERLKKKALSDLQLVGRSGFDRKSALKTRGWSKNDGDVSMLLFLLTDPDPDISTEAERQLKKVFVGSTSIPTTMGLTRVQRIHAWTQFIVNLGPLPRDSSLPFFRIP